MYPGRRQYIETMGVIVMRAYAHLYRASRVDDPFAGGAQKHTAVIQSLPIVVPGVGMSIEMDQRQRSMLLGVSAQQWVGDEMIATKREHGSPAGQDLVGMSSPPPPPPAGDSRNR